MSTRGKWRGLAITYGVVAGIQGYLAVTTSVTWAVVVASACGLIAIACGVTAWRVTENGHSSSTSAQDRHSIVDRNHTLS
ncbi:hypothetical protein ACFWY9_20605 [Amycolatopsis sp. NPDC059027]|uniref:hypothetical protein n=1 Tax=Amycolatopsis sp. NPDC059027 TaxID=3346709 RepID=UPI0036714082